MSFALSSREIPTKTQIPCPMELINSSPTEIINVS